MITEALALHPLALHPLAKSGEAVKAGPIGLGVILLLCIACYFLFKSMSKHLRNVRENFPGDKPPAPPSRAQPAQQLAQQPVAQQPVAQQPVAQRPVDQQPVPPPSQAPGQDPPVAE